MCSVSIDIESVELFMLRQSRYIYIYAVHLQITAVIACSIRCRCHLWYLWCSRVGYYCGCHLEEVSCWSFCVLNCLTNPVSEVRVHLGFLQSRVTSAFG